MPEEDPEGANTLRDRLQQRSHQASSALARAVIAEEGLQFVEASEFEGMDPDKVEQAVRDRNAERSKLADQALETRLKEMGVENVDELLNQGGGGEGSSQTSEQQAQLDRVRGVGGAGAPPALKGIDLTGIENDGQAQMSEYFKAGGAAGRKR